MNNEAIKKIADTYGYDAQSRQLIEEMAELTEAYRVASFQNDDFYPLDWMETTTPERYMLNGKEITFNWYTARGNESIADTIR